MKVYIIGAGPGDPELITVKGQRLIANCPIILYTGSLVPEAVLDCAPQGARRIDSSKLTLDEIIEIITDAKQSGLDVARVHTGDPALFSSVAEQLRRLDALGIEYEIVPGVSSYSAASAALHKELTLPELTQTVIISRAEGRTPVPPEESLARLATHRSTLVLFLSAGLLHKICAELTPHYGETCPVAIVHRASQPDQQILVGTLADIEEKWRASEIRSQAIIIVGEILTASDFADSRLYAADFSHRFRKGIKNRTTSGE